MAVFFTMFVAPPSFKTGTFVAVAVEAPEVRGVAPWNTSKLTPLRFCESKNVFDSRFVSVIVTVPLPNVNVTDAATGKFVPLSVSVTLPAGV
jgi:hypothetical protein